jgi:sec-independent protein translocase protein TatA
MGELIIILAIFVLLFGARRLPALADGMGKAIRNFKKGLNSPDEDVTPPPEVTPPPRQVSDTSSASELEGSSADPQSVKRADGS